MKKIIAIILTTLLTMGSFAQSKKEKQLIERTQLLGQTVFGTKDKATLEDLFAKQATYGHSGGRIENREEAIAGISNNLSTFTDTSARNINVVIEDDVAIVRHLFNATETNKEGKISQLNFTVMLVWVKENSKWKLMGRQAVKI